MRRLVAITSGAVLLGVAAAMPASAAPAPRVIQTTFTESANSATVMVVRVWTPDGKSSSSMRCVGPAYHYGATSTAAVTTWTKVCSATPAARKVQVTDQIPFAASSPRTMFVRIWAPNGKTSTAWSCKKPTYSYKKTSKSYTWWLKGKCTAT